MDLLEESVRRELGELETKSFLARKWVERFSGRLLKSDCFLPISAVYGELTVLLEGHGVPVAFECSGREYHLQVDEDAGSMFKECSASIDRIVVGSAPLRAYLRLMPEGKVRHQVYEGRKKQQHYLDLCACNRISYVHLSARFVLPLGETL